MFPKKALPKGFQSDFSHSLLDPRAGIPHQLKASGQNFPKQRFDVYRNNVFSSLVQALEEGFPVVKRLVGAEFFRGVASCYVQQVMPVSPVIMIYGKSFPDFLEGFAPAEALPYLADIARLEWLYSESFHAKDEKLVSMASVFEAAREQLAQVVFGFHPACRMLTSPYAILSLWQSHQGGISDEDIVLPEIDMSEEVLITRPGLVVELRWLTLGGAHFIQLLQQGKTLGEAAHIVLEENPDFILETLLDMLFESGAIASFHIHTE